jgi:glycosyltransferase involved in cell wall biosynthesis
MCVLVFNATNIRDGGGVTHLTEILKKVSLEKYLFSKIVVVGSKQLLDLIEDRTWIEKKTHPYLNKSGFYIQIWRLFFFNKLLNDSKCDLLFDPGGGYNGKFRPFVTMCRNMLVFEKKERARYKYTFIYFRLILLQFLQIKSFTKASSVIFISKYADLYLRKNFNLILQSSKIIHHGVSTSFNELVKKQENISSYSFEKPFKLLYVSIIDLYKHQDLVVAAIDRLRNQDKLPVEIDLVGSTYKPALKKLINLLDGKQNSGINLVGKVDYVNLKEIYSRANAFVFASTCENMPNILIESMRSGLPICCSKKQPMPEFLGEKAFYFDAEDADSIYDTIKQMLLSSSLRAIYAHESKELSYNFDWTKCANETFSELEHVFLGQIEQG